MGFPETFKALSDPIRREILLLLRSGRMSAGDIAAQFSLSEKLRTHLSHILLSHHGQREFGSPVVPATPEELIVSSADELDFRMFCWKDSVKNLTDDQPISAWNNSTQRRFWKK